MSGSKRNPCPQGKEVSEFFAELHRLYKGTSFTLALSILSNLEAAEDAHQDGWMKIYRSLAGEMVDGKDNWRAWCNAVVRNHCIDCLRKRQRELAVASEDMDVVVEPACGTEQAEVAVVLAEAIAALPVDLAQMMRLHSGLVEGQESGLSIREMARVLELPKHKVEYRLKRGKEMLRQELGQRFPQFVSLMQ